MIFETIVSILFICLLYIFLKIYDLSENMILTPLPMDNKRYLMMLNDPYIINESINSSSDIVLDAFFCNKYKKPSYDSDIIYLYSHGNSASCSNVLDSTAVIYILNRREKPNVSIFVYDYRGYGKSTGKKSSYGCLKDVVNVYKFLINEKGVDPERIILFGHSLGCCITTYLMDYILHHYDNSPKLMVLQNPFHDIHRICNDVIPFSGYLFFSPLLTDKYIKSIDKHKRNINICFIHSKDDKLINYKHSIDLASHIKNNDCKVIMTTGTHGAPIISDEFDNYLNMIMSSKYSLK